MNLYIITTKNRRGEIDTFPMVGANDKAIYDRLNQFAKQIQEHLDEDDWIESCSFKNPIQVDGYEIILRKIK